jgi:hypothetical protein
MCDYSLHHVNSRPAKIGDRLTTRNFGLGTRGFAASDEKVPSCLPSARDGVVLCRRG